VGGVRPGGFVGIEPHLALQARRTGRAVAGEVAQVLAYQGEHVVRAHAASRSSGRRRRRRTAFACASSPSASARVIAWAPIAPTRGGLASCTLTKFWRPATVTSS